MKYLIVLTLLFGSTLSATASINCENVLQEKVELQQQLADLRNQLRSTKDLSEIELNEKRADYRVIRNNMRINEDDAQECLSDKTLTKKQRLAILLYLLADA